MGDLGGEKLSISYDVCTQPLFEGRIESASCFWGWKGVTEFAGRGKEILRERVPFPASFIFARPKRRGRGETRYIYRNTGKNRIAERYTAKARLSRRRREMRVRERAGGSKVLRVRKSEPELAWEVAVLRLTGYHLVEEVLEHLSLTMTERKSISDSSDGVSDEGRKGEREGGCRRQDQTRGRRREREGGRKRSENVLEDLDIGKDRREFRHLVLNERVLKESKESSRSEIPRRELLGDVLNQ